MRWLVRFVALLSLLSLGSTSIASAEELLVLEPQGPWAVDYADNSCALMRTFVAGPETYRLELRQYEPDGLMEVAIGGKLKGRIDKYRYAFLPDSSMREMYSATVLKNPNGMKIVRFTAASVRTVKETESFYSKRRWPEGSFSFETVPQWPKDLRKARSQAIEGLKVDNLLPQATMFKTGPMTGPLAAMDTCFDDLMRRWNVDPAVQRNLSKGVVLRTGNNQREFWDAHDAVMAILKTNSTRIRFLVGADGKMTGCNVIGLAQNVPQAAKLCSLYRDPDRFLPALDSNGKPVDSYFYEEISVGVVAAP